MKVVPRLVARVFLPGVIAAEDVDAALEWMNEHHALVFTGSRTAVWTRRFDRVLKRWEWASCSLSDFRAFYAAYILYQGKRARSLADVWLSSPLARRYRAVVFDPTEQHADDELNLWPGFSVTPAKGDCSKYKQHVWEILAQESQECFDYIWSWMADATQHPERPARSALVFRGLPGAGKSLPVTLFGELFGSSFAHISHQGQVTGRFNSALAYKVPILLDEALWAGEKAGESVFKAIVTEKTFAVERKGQEVVVVPNMAHLILCTNHDWAAPAGIGDRRIAAFDVSPTRIDDHPYFDALQAEYDSGGAAALLWELQHFPLNGYQPSHIPQTHAKSDQSFHTMDDTDRWWYGLLCMGLTVDGVWADRVERGKLYDLYTKDARTLNIRRVLTPAELGKCLKQRWNIPSLQSTMARFYVVGTLEAARDAFRRRMKVLVDWNDPPPAE